MLARTYCVPCGRLVPIRRLSIRRADVEVFCIRKDCRHAGWVESLPRWDRPEDSWHRSARSTEEVELILMKVDPRGEWDPREAWLLLSDEEYDAVMDEESSRQMRQAFHRMERDK